MANLTDTSMTLTSQVSKYANHLVTNDAYMAALTSKIAQLQADIKNLKRKLAGHIRKVTGATHNN